MVLLFISSAIDSNLRSYDLMAFCTDIVDQAQGYRTKFPDVIVMQLFVPFDASMQ